MKADFLKAGTASTSVMTLFSYLWGRKHKEKFSEPVLLNQLIFPQKKKRNTHNAAGYALHYLVGYFFSVFYEAFWSKYRATLRSGVLLGFVNGLAGIAGWKAVFKIHQGPPLVDLRKYLAQLLLAHGIFGLCNALIFRILRKMRAQ